MKKLLIFIFIPFSFFYAQRIGEIAPDPEPVFNPTSSWGVDIMFGEGGFGLGTFYRKDLSQSLTGFIDLSFSESKDEREVEYIDYWGITYTIGKKNRVFLLPLNFGLQYRLFENELTDNLRPYLNAAIGPNMLVVTPYEKEFFNSFGYAQMKYALGGYIGLGANFGISKSELVGINIRYYYIHLFDEGVESLKNKYRKDFGHIYLTINIGLFN